MKVKSRGTLTCFNENVIIYSSTPAEQCILKIVFSEPIQSSRVDSTPARPRVCLIHREASWATELLDQREGEEAAFDIQQACGEEALRSSPSADLYIIEVEPPALPSFELLARLRARHRRARFVVVSNRLSEGELSLHAKVRSRADAYLRGDATLHDRIAAFLHPKAAVNHGEADDEADEESARETGQHASWKNRSENAAGEFRLKGTPRSGKWDPDYSSSRELLRRTQEVLRNSLVPRSVTPARLDSRDREVAHLRRDLEEARKIATVSPFAATFRKLQDDYAARVAEIAELERLLRTERSRCQKLESERNDMASVQRKVDDEQSDLEARTQLLLSQISALNQERERLQHDSLQAAKAWQEQLSDQQRQFVSLSARYEALEKQRRQEIAQVRQRCEQEIAAHRDAMAAEKRDAMAELHQAFRQNHRSHNDALRRLEERCQHLEQELRASVNARREDAASHAREAAMWQRERRQLEAELSDLMRIATDIDGPSAEDRTLATAGHTSAPSEIAADEDLDLRRTQLDYHAMPAALTNNFE